jgi:hypothetical protein
VAHLALLALPANTNRVNNTPMSARLAVLGATQQLWQPVVLTVHQDVSSLYQDKAVAVVIVTVGKVPLPALRYKAGALHAVPARIIRRLQGCVLAVLWVDTAYQE